MILVCASCKASYLVSASVFAAGARNVRCARCSHTWLADLMPHMAVMPVEPDNQIQSRPAAQTPSLPQPQGGQTSGEKTAFINPSPPIPNLPVVRKKIPWSRILRAAYMAFGLLAFGALTWFFITSPLPGKIGHGAKQFFDAIGVTKPVLGEDFSLQNIRSERRFEAGGMQLVVEGDVTNDGDETRAVPDISIKALGPDKAVIQSWRIDAPAATLAAGASVPFRSSVVTPPGTVMEVNLSFVEPRHDNQP